jgi:hypothetical protein
MTGAGHKFILVFDPNAEAGLNRRTTLMNNNHTQRRRSKGWTALTILILALVGPGLGLVWWALGLTLAPPWIFLDGAIYVLLACGGLPLGLIALWTKRLKMWGLLATLGLTGIAAILFFVIVGRSGGPTGMTSCQPLAAPPPQVRYACMSTSSDNANFRYEFTLEGWANSPVMRIVNSKLSR